MSCNTECGIIAVEILTGPPGVPGPKGDTGAQGPPGALGGVSGDIELTQSGQNSVAKVIGLQSKPVAATTPAADQILTYNGTAWVPSTFSAGYY